MSPAALSALLVQTFTVTLRFLSPPSSHASLPSPSPVSPRLCRRKNRFRARCLCPLLAGQFATTPTGPLIPNRWRRHFAGAKRHDNQHPRPFDSFDHIRTHSLNARTRYTDRRHRSDTRRWPGRNKRGATSAFCPAVLSGISLRKQQSQLVCDPPPSNLRQPSRRANPHHIPCSASHSIPRRYCNYPAPLAAFIYFYSQLARFWCFVYFYTLRPYLSERRIDNTSCVSGISPAFDWERDYSCTLLAGWTQDTSCKSA